MGTGHVTCALKNALASSTLCAYIHHAHHMYVHPTINMLVYTMYAFHNNSIYVIVTII